MATGIRIRGLYGQLQISQESPVNSILFSGSLGAMSPYGPDGRYCNAITFPATITTSEQPLVFLRVTNTVRIIAVRMVGSPGAWTGFWIWGTDGADAQGGGANIVSILGTWFITTTQSAKSSAKYGIRIRNPDTNAIVFDSGYPIAKFLSWTPTFTNQRVLSTGYNSGGIGSVPGGYFDWFRADAAVPWDQNGHFLANSYTGMIAGGTGTHPCGMYLIFNTVSPYVFSVDTSCKSGEGPSIFGPNSWNLVWATPGP